jgi:HK97 gp10 family phage protein
VAKGGSYILGRDLLRKALDKLPVIAKQKLQVALTAEANGLADLMRARVPVKDGTLRASIRVEPRKQAGLIGALIKAGGPTTTKPVRKGQSATYDYAMAQELGTQEMLANPFFFPSYRQKKTSIKRRASKAVRDAVGEITK